MTMGRHKSNISLTNETPYLAHTRENYGVSIVRIFEKIDRVLTALHCMW